MYVNFFTNFDILLYFTLAFSPLVCAEIISYIHYKSYKKTIIEYENQLKYLEKKLEKEKLMQMKNNEEVIKQEKEYKTINLEQPKKIQELQDNFSLYYTLGANQDKYLKNYQKGDIDKYLQDKEYNDEQINIVHYYLDEKAKTLTKKKKIIFYSKLYF